MLQELPLYQKVVVWGDSLAKGVVWNSERGRYANSPDTAAETAAEELGIEVVNRARFGFTAPQGLELMEHDLESGLTCDAAIIEFGGNDCNFDWAAISEAPEQKHDPKTLPEVFERTIRRMVQMLRERGIVPILMTLPPIDAEKYFHFLVGDKLSAENVKKWLGDTQRIYRFQEMYSHMIARVAREMECALIDLREKCLFDKPMFSMLCEDGLHLTPEGQHYVGEQIARIIRPAAVCGA